MDLLPTLLQALCVCLDLYLLAKLPNGMPRHYVGFSLVRSLIRAYAQWLCSVETWRMVYWWSELMGYLIVIILVAGVTEELLNHHVNTHMFYATLGLGITIVALWKLPNPLTLNSLWWVGNMARTAALFLLLLALVIGKKWRPVERWIGWGLLLNLGTQWYGGWLQLTDARLISVTLVQQLGYLNLQLCWIIGTNRAANKPPTPAEALNAGL